MARLLVITLLTVMLTACGSSESPTPTPTKTPTPAAAIATEAPPTETPTPLPAIEQTALVATDTPVPPSAPPTDTAPAESLGQAVAVTLFDEAYTYVVQNGASGATDNQLILALVGMMQRLPKTLGNVQASSVVQEDEILLDACQQIAFNLSLRSDSIEAQNNLQDLADACVGLRLSAISGSDPSADIAKLAAPIKYLSQAFAQ